MGDELYGPRGGVMMAGAAADDGERAAIGAFSQRFLAMSRDAIILAVAGVAEESSARGQARAAAR